MTAIIQTMTRTNGAEVFSDSASIELPMATNNTKVIKTNKGDFLSLDLAWHSFVDLDKGIFFKVGSSIYKLVYKVKSVVGSITYGATIYKEVRE